MKYNYLCTAALGLCLTFGACSKPQRETPITARGLTPEEIRHYQKLANEKDANACYILADYYNTVGKDRSKAAYYSERLGELIKRESEKEK